MFTDTDTDLEVRKVSAIKKWPEIEHVSSTENWLLDDYGNRVRRICGAQRVGQPQGRVCLVRAGNRTIHVGLGPCRKHEPSGPALNRMFRAVSLEVGELPANHPLRIHIERTFELSKKMQATLPYPELSALLVFQSLRLSALLDHLDTSDVREMSWAIDTMKRDIKDVADMRERIWRMERESKVVTRESLELFMFHIMSIAKDLVADRETLKLFFQRLSQVPMSGAGLVHQQIESSVDSEVV